jgi:hypothetical protein
MSEDYIKIDENTVELISKKVIRLDVLRAEIAELINQADQIIFIQIDNNLGEDIREVLSNENARRDEQKSYFLEQARMKQEELAKYD